MTPEVERWEADPIGRELSDLECETLEAALRQARLRHERMKGLSGEILKPTDRVLVIDMTDDYGIFGARNHAALERLDKKRLRLGMECETGRSSLPQLRATGTQRATMAYKLGIRPERIDVYNPWQEPLSSVPEGNHALVVFSGSPAYLLNGSEQDEQMTVRGQQVLRAVVQNDIPFIGVCYGMQMACASMGAQIRNAKDDDTTYCVSGLRLLKPTPFGQNHPVHAGLPPAVPPIAIASHRQIVRVGPSTDPRLRVLSTYPGTDIVTMATIRGRQGTLGLVSQLHTEVGIPAIHVGAVADGVGTGDTDRLLPHIDAVSQMSERFFVQALEMVRNHHAHR